jgi:hypothetical protein
MDGIGSSWHPLSALVIFVPAGMKSKTNIKDMTVAGMIISCFISDHSGNNF